jgi:phosphoribosylformylglycinamidine cyclo-ligase
MRQSFLPVEAKPWLMDRATDAYAAAGVDISAGNAAVSLYKQLTGAWKHPDQIGELGAFNGLFRLPGDPEQALVASTDGVGTKILIAAILRRYNSVGADLVNHCVNDILVANATPLFFLDYVAVGKLVPEMAGEIVGGIHQACRENQTALLGGETAEMPGLYKVGEFDLAGTIVGIVRLADLPKTESVAPGDAIIALPAIGLHTNGYSLARTLVPEDEWGALLPESGVTFADALLAPHPSYLNTVKAIRAVAHVKAMSHITGGGLLENVPRTLPAACKAIFEQTRWEVPPLMRELVRRGNLSHEDRYRTFNMGIGYTLTVALSEAPRALAAAPGAFVAGWIEARSEGDPAVVVHPARER